MAEKPILFCTDMVKAILDGRKTVTRRVIKEVPNFYHLTWQGGPKKGQPRHIMDWPLSDIRLIDGEYWVEVQTAVDDTSGIKAKPRYQKGDLLWVKETYCHGIEWDDCKPSEVDPLCGGNDIWYFADGERPTDGWGKKRTSRFMTKWVARTWLEVLNVRAERLQEITPADCELEGLKLTTHPNLICGKYRRILGDFKDLWYSLNAKRGYPWDSNPWVWRYEFKIVNHAPYAVHGSQCEGKD